MPLRFAGYGRCLIALLFLIPATLAANPVSLDPTAGIGKGLGIAVVAFALAAEVMLTAATAIWLCRITLRPQLATAFVVLNLSSYIVFIRLLHPLMGKILIVESLILIVEAAGMLAITYQLSEKPLTPKRALALSFAGNLLSFLIGYGV